MIVSPGDLEADAMWKMPSSILAGCPAGPSVTVATGSCSTCPDLVKFHKHVPTLEGHLRMETCGDEWSGYGRSVKRETDGTCAYSPTSFGMIDGIILSGNLGGFLMVCNLTTTRNHMRPRDVLLVKMR